MKEKFKIGDIVILKSDINKELPVKMTITNTFNDEEVICMWSQKDGDIKERCIPTEALEYVIKASKE